ncbi:ArsR/SmtB family transcription factor [Paenibacillus azoreducens]|uniref:ArsR/SmtB family transcription factor n=1 Tax=Paenibacillus azoreducens TaxID=116718 RepID=UPI0039F4DA04
MKNVSIEAMANHFKLLGDRTRLNIISMLYRQEMCVCQLVDLLNTTQPNISQHLRKLKDAGLVREEKRGQWSYYSIKLQDKPHLQDVLKYLPDLDETLKKKMNESICE